MSKPTIIVIGTPSFYGKSLHEIFAEECIDFHIVQASFTPKPVIEPSIFDATKAPRTNEPWYRQFDKKRKK